MSTAKPPTFGETIRGARLGYHWSARHAAMVRISDRGPHFEVRMCPPAQLPKGLEKNRNLEYRCWWESNVDLLTEIVPLRSIKSVKAPLRFLVDDSGHLVRGASV